MARTFYGGSPGDSVAIVDPADGDYAPATGTFTVWDAASTGTRLTDLQDAAGNSVTVVTPDARGVMAFFGPDGFTAAVWIEDTTGYRWRIDPADLASRSGLSNGLPAGGTAGQVVKKNSGTNYDASWQDEAGGSVAAGVIVDTTNGLTGPSVQEALDALLARIQDLENRPSRWA